MKKQLMRIIQLTVVLLIAINGAGVAQKSNEKTKAKSVQKKAQEQATENPQELIGKWICKTDDGTSTLEFLTQATLRFDGEESEYRLVPGTIRVKELFGEVDYPYQINDDKLIITFPEEGPLIFQRAGKGNKSIATKEQEKSSPSGNEHLLRGKFYSYSSISTLGGSSAWERWAVFDGKGNFTYGSESSHSINTPDVTGGVYGADQSADNRGTYRVSGDRIILTFPDGSTDEAEVIERWNDGGIAGFKFQGKTYGGSRE